MSTDRAIVVGPGRDDQSPDGPKAKAKMLGIDVNRIVEFRVAHIRSTLSDDNLARLADRLLIEPVGQWWVDRDSHTVESHGAETGVTVVETGLRPGVTDREGVELVRAANQMGLAIEAGAIAKRWFLEGELSTPEVELLVERVLHNDVIERWSVGALAPSHADQSAVDGATSTIALGELDRDGLIELSQQRRLGLTGDEMVVIQGWFGDQQRDATDAELEMLAQTWSEHCSHKTFRALIETEEGEIDGLLKTYLRGATDTINAPWVESAFVDNAGIVHFDDTFDLALKAETHNHPSALEPFGGANTGVGGVVRDILGVSAQPIAITDILCFGPQDLPVEELPEGVLHPRRIRSGVIAGVGDYGNKIGVPNIGGSILHDASYTTTPLVFAGCIGLLPRGSNPTNAQPGDFIVVLGGAVGRDGVGGATFSSQSMTTETADVAGSSVQIGDPVVEKGLIDLVLAAREEQLYTAITDCGAGGLSSAVGEMAEVLGAEVDLDTVPRKYPGLAPWEVWLSEAQERMVLAVPDPAPLLELAAKWQVEAAVIGKFTGDGRLQVSTGGTNFIDLDTKFLHDGRPRLHLKASLASTDRPPRREAADAMTSVEALLAILAHPSVRSNEEVIRTYDHEILGGTIVRPYGGVAQDGPADGTVIVPPGTATMGDQGPIAGATIGIGSAILVGRHDCEAMAWAAVDEAVRNAVVGGVDPDRLSLLDNFAWGNPTDPATLGQLVAACKGCHDAAIAHGAPYVSGKDSLFNEFVLDDGAGGTTRDPVTPTLIITAVGVTPNVDLVPATGVVAAGNDVWLIGSAAGNLGASYYDEVHGQDFGGPVPAPDANVVAHHRQLFAAISEGQVVSAHDLSDGGLAVAAAEWAFAGRLGLDLAISPDHNDATPAEVMFGEGPGRYLVEVAPDQSEQFAATVPSARKLGRVADSGHVEIELAGSKVLQVDLTAIGSAFKNSAHRNSAFENSEAGQ